MGLEHGALLLLLDMWERPAFYLERLDQGATLDLELARLEEEEAALRVSGDLSSSSLMSVADMAAFAALLDRPIEDWMVYLHPEQTWPVEPLGRRAGARQGAQGRARRSSRSTGPDGSSRTARSRVLLTTFISTLPDVWKGLFATFAPEVALEDRHAVGRQGRPPALPSRAAASSSRQGTTSAAAQ